MTKYIIIDTETPDEANTRISSIQHQPDRHHTGDGSGRANVSRGVGGDKAHS